MVAERFASSTVADASPGQPQREPYAAGMTGLTEKAAREAGFEVGVSIIHKDHHAGYYPGARELTLQLVYDRKTGRLLGGEAFGPEGIDKRIDVLAIALLGELSLDDLAELAEG